MYVDDRHDRPGWRARRPDHSATRRRRRLHLDDVRRAAPGGRRQLEGVPAGRQLRLQHAGEVRAFQNATPGSTAVRARDASAARGHLRGRRAQRPAAGGVLDHAAPASSRSTRTICRPPAPTSSPRRSRRSRPTRRCGRRPRSSSTTTRTTACSTTCRRRPRRPGTPDEFVTACRSAAGFRVPAIVISPGPPAVGSRPSLRPHLGAAVPGAVHRRGGAEHQRVAPPHLRRPDLPRSASARPARIRRACRTTRRSSGEGEGGGGHAAETDAPGRRTRRPAPGTREAAARVRPGLRGLRLSRHRRRRPGGVGHLPLLYRLHRCGD